MSWNNQGAGQHTLRAVLVKGSTYSANLVGRNSVQTTDVNNGQISQNYPSGLSSPAGMVYDASLDKVFIINEIGGTVTVLEGSSQDVQETITFNTDFTQTGISITGYTFDQNHHRLFILRDGILSIIDTQTNGLVANISYPSQREDPNQIYRQKVRYDQEGRYIYFYNSLWNYYPNIQNDTKIQVHRVDLQTNTLDTAWDQAHGLINGLVDFLPSIDEKIYLVTYGSVSVLNNLTGATSPINYDLEGQCTNYQWGTTIDASAMSMDFKKLYFSCAKQEQDGRSQIVAYDTETESEINSFEMFQGFNTGNGLGGGQLAQRYYVQQAWYADRLEVYDTETNTALPEVTNLNAIESDYASERTYGVVSGNNSLYILTRNQYTNKQSLYKVEPNTGSITAQHTYESQSDPTGFYGSSGSLAKLSGTNDKVLVTSEDNHHFQLDPVAGTSEAANYGMNPTFRIYHSKQNKRLFSLPIAKNAATTNIPVGNTLTGEYESTITLNNFIGGYAYMSESGSTLYVAGIAPDAWRVYAIDTLTLSVSQIYTSMNVQVLNNQDWYDLNTASLVGHGNELIFATCGKIYKLNLTNDTTQTVSTGRTSCFANAQIILASALSGDGARLAIVTDWGFIDIYNTASLEKVRTIERTSTPLTDGFHDVRFGTDGDIAVSSFGTTPQLFKYKLSDGSLIETIPIENLCDDSNYMRSVTLANTNNADYVTANLICLDPVNPFSNSQAYTSLINTSLGNQLYNRETETSAITAYYLSRFNGRVNDLDIDESTVNVTTIGESVVITSPANNAKLDKGFYTITGSAPRNAVITITIDGVAVGTTQSNEVGVWQRDYNFATSGSKRIQALQVEAGLISATHTVQIMEPVSFPPPTAFPPPPSTLDTDIFPVIQANTSQNQTTPPYKSPARVAPLDKSEKKLTQQAAVTKSIFSIKRFTKIIPRPLLDSVPYALMLVLITQAGYYLFQSQKQLKMENRLKEIYEKQDVLNGERRNFLEVTSHYLRTPLTYIKAGTEMLVKDQPGNPKSHELNESVAHLGLFIESLVEESNNTSELDKIKEPPKIKSALLSKYFLVPLAGLLVTIGLFYLIFGVIGGIRYSTATYVTQGLIVFLLVQLFYGAYKNSQRVKIERAHTEDLIKAEEAFDHTRSKLIADAGSQLNARMSQIEAILTQVGDPNASNQRIVAQGIERLRDLSKSFLLVSQLEASNLSKTKTTIHARDFVADIITSFEADLKSKNLKTEVVGLENDATFTSDQSLSSLALRSLIQNAIQVSEEGSTITIKCIHTGKRLAFQVIDQGEGIPKEKIDQLFEPFIKVGPVTTFNHEGIGLSLYLDRLIMHGLGGDIDIASQLKRGTTATLSFND